ncbi:MAG: hypothetical protein CVU51_14235 [Deltaproteobacteria bacterium HGW-Deltaproteobacteria-1]|nr:MAG: hypothetical protein CVU51_14235 [Deltaproteobacteria bacterium HGW-Deltaproteobacteria-1]
MTVHIMNGHSYNLVPDEIMEKQQRKKREFNMRRTAILSAAEKIFSEKGFHNVTVAEIAMASGFSTGYLYQFFKGKEHLYTTMISEKLTFMYQSIEQKVASVKDLHGKLAAIIVAQLQFVEKNAAFCRIFLRGENELSPLTMDMCSCCFPVFPSFRQGSRAFNP